MKGEVEKGSAIGKKNSAGDEKSRLSRPASCATFAKEPGKKTSDPGQKKLCPNEDEFVARP